MIRPLAWWSALALGAAFWGGFAIGLADEPPSGPLAPVTSLAPEPRPETTARRMAGADARLIESTTMPPAAPPPYTYVCPDSLVVVGDWCLTPEETRTAEKED